MDFVEALKSNNDDDIINFFKPIKCMSEEQDHCFKSLIKSMEEKFHTLLSDDEDSDKPEFLIPDLAKYRKEVKGKRTSRAKKKPSTATRVSSLQKPNYASEIQKNGDSSSANSTRDSIDSCDSLRKSSRLASKANQIPQRETYVATSTVSNDKIIQNATFVTEPSTSSQMPLVKPFVQIPQIKKEPRRSSLRLSNMIQNTNSDEHGTQSKPVIRVRENVSDPPSPSLPPAKIRCLENVGSFGLNMSRRSLDISHYTSEMKEPLGSSTPTNERIEKIKNPNLLQSPLIVTPKNVDTAKKAKTKPNIVTEQNSSAIKGVLKVKTQDKILQEKNTNVRTIEEKCQEAQKKKEDIIKSSAEEAKRKREERTRKVAASREANMQEKIKQKQKQESERVMRLKQAELKKFEKLHIELLKKKQAAVARQAEVEKRKEEMAKLVKSQKLEPKSELNEYAIDHVLDGASSDEEERPKNKIPSWATKENRRRPLCIQAWLDRKELIRPWFFNPNLKYPKLETLFAGADIKMRPRASSAFWNSVIVDFDEAFPLHD